ncbi:hypothetical protein EBZ80_20000 [bacterium]|nr:hypothetical protein [bacterium]
MSTARRYDWIDLQPAPPGDKHKWAARFRDRTSGRVKTTLFGARGYDDYTMHKDRVRRDRYRFRHMKDLRTQDPTRAGFLSFYLLWGDSTSLAANVRAYRRQFFSR